MVIEAPKEGRRISSILLLAFVLATAWSTLAPGGADAAELYWGESDYFSSSVAGSILRAPANTGAIDSGFSIGLGTPPSGSDPLYYPAVSGDYVYWASAYSTSGGTPYYGYIGRARRDGTGTPDPTFITITGGWRPSGLAVKGEHLYWSAYGPGNGRIGRATLDGGSVDQAFVSDTGLSAQSPGGVAASDDHLYWTGADFSVPEAVIGRASRSSGTVDSGFRIASGADPYTTQQNLTVDDTHVYWASPASSGNWIGRAQLDGTLSNPTWINASSYPTGVAVDGSHVYWTRLFGYAIGKANLDGSGPPNPAFIPTTLNPGGIAIAPAQLPLSVTRSGTGTGTVTSSPTGIDCGSTCSTTFDEGTSVTLTASAASGSSFGGWGGDCSGSTSICTVTMSQARSVTATFTSDAPTPPGPTPTPPGPIPTPEADLRVSLGGPKKVRAGRGFMVGIRVRNTGSGKAESVKTCLNLPRSLFLVQAKGAKVSGRSVCWTRSSLGAGKSVSFKAKVRSSASDDGSVAVRATSRASNASGGTVSAGGEEEVRVVKPRPQPEPKPPTG